MMLGHPPGDEERGGHPLLGEDVEQPRDPDLGAVAALREHARPRRVGRITREPATLGVEIEGEHDRDARAAWPR